VAEWNEDDLCLVSLCTTAGVGPSAVRALRAEADRRSAPFAEVIGLPAGELTAAGLSRRAAEAVSALQRPLFSGRTMLDRLHRMGYRLHKLGDSSYPPALAGGLGPDAPPLLLTAGDASLLLRRCMALVGSRRPSRSAAAAAGSLAAALAAEGAAVVSGGARGIDTAAHTGALRQGGTVYVPASGLTSFRRKQRGLDRPPEGAWCLLGQFPPQAGWQAAYALIRNRTVAALSEAVVAFEPRDSGGTWHTCLNALRMRKPLFVVSATRRGARGRGLCRLVRLGAVALDLETMPGPASLDRLVADYEPPTGVDQLPLFETPEV
jgi:DNA processing protein